jgi:hypothetical protein
VIERLRQSGIRLDREGRFWHEGRAITHGRFRKTLLRWLDVLDDGRPILRLDAQRFAYVEVDDAHLLAVAAHWRGNRVFLVLNDGSEEELDYASLCVDPRDDALYCSVRGGRLEARITTAAYYEIATRIVEEDGRFSLRASGNAFPIGTREGISR